MFEERIASDPGQCVRYCFEEGAAPLWPNRQRPMMEASSVPPCERCGAPREFEFQVLPQLLNLLGHTSEDTSYDWSSSPDGNQGYLRGTLVVYSCSESCDLRQPLPSEASMSQAYASEFVFVQPM